jgi:hypothetical protein
VVVSDVVQREDGTSDVMLAVPTDEQGVSYTYWPSDREPPQITRGGDSDSSPSLALGRCLLAKHKFLPLSAAGKSGADWVMPYAQEMSEDRQSQVRVPRICGPRSPRREGVMRSEHEGRCDPHR